MNRSLLTILLIFISLGCIVNESYGWDGVPIAVISGYDPKYVLRYVNLHFDGGNSHDHDPPPEGSYIITDYDWIWPSSAYDIWESLDAGKTAKARFSPPGEYTVRLKVKDNENIWSIIDQCTVRVVEVTLSGGEILPVGDLVEIDLSVNPDSFGGEMKLTALGAYRNSIKVWNEESKQTLYIGNGTYYKTWAPDALPATLWVEGISPTGTPTQAKLTLLYDPPSHTYLNPVEEIYFTVVKVDITDDGGNPLPAPPSYQEACVGQNISLKTKIEPSGLTASNWQWTIPGTVVKNYADGTVTSLTDTDKQQSTVQFHWVDGAISRDVSVSCQIEGVSCTDTVEFYVKEPTLNSFTSETGQIDADDSSLYCGIDSPGNYGIEWSADITSPAGFGGDVKFVQLVKEDVQRTKTDDSTESMKIPTWWLDGADPYSGPYGIQQATRKTFSGSDSPAIALEVGYKKMNNKFQQFEVYVMFKPTVGGIWVPVGELSWGWSGIAESSDGGNSWTKTSGAHDDVDPDGSATTAFPEWSETATETNPDFIPD